MQWLPQTDVRYGWNDFRVQQVAAAPLVQGHVSSDPIRWPAVRAAIDLYEAGGAAALIPKERGRKRGEGRNSLPGKRLIFKN